MIRFTRIWLSWAVCRLSDSTIDVVTMVELWAASLVCGSGWDPVGPIVANDADSDACYVWTYVSTGFNGVGKMIAPNSSIKPS